jgi:cell division protein FtsB
MKKMKVDPLEKMLPQNLDLDNADIYDKETGKTVSNIEFSEVLKLAIENNNKSETIKALKQKIDELTAENLQLRTKAIGMADVQAMQHDEINALEAENAELKERILDLEACK